jgi:hypothetical protein
MTTGTFKSIRWLRRFFNHRFVLVSFWSYIQNQDRPDFRVCGQMSDDGFQSNTSGDVRAKEMAAVKGGHFDKRFNDSSHLY